jgi:hypothetical protein
MRWRLHRLLKDHDRAEADIAARDGKPPRLTDEQADELWRLVHEIEAEMCAHCPDCGEEMQDEAFEFWCPRCEAAVSYARAAAEGA